MKNFDTTALRLDTEQDRFPYRVGLVHYLCITKEGDVSQPNKKSLYRAVRLAEDGKGILLALWPGQWRSDYFHVTDFKALRAANDLPTRREEDKAIKHEEVLEARRIEEEKQVAALGERYGYSPWAGPLHVQANGTVEACTKHGKGYCGFHKFGHFKDRKGLERYMKDFHPSVTLHSLEAA